MTRNNIRKALRTILSASTICAMLAGGVPTVSVYADNDTASVEMLRLYNPNSGEHFYTADVNEKNSLVRAGWKFEGTGWFAPQSSSTPVYRLYNKNAGDHHYTMNGAEKDNLVRHGWKYEGIGWYSDDAEGAPLYRQYNPNAKAGSHNYTLSKAENDSLVALGWRAEGIGWYGLAESDNPADNTTSDNASDNKGGSSTNNGGSSTNKGSTDPGKKDTDNKGTDTNYNKGNTGTSDDNNGSTTTPEKKGHYETVVDQEAWDEPEMTDKEVIVCGYCKSKGIDRYFDKYGDDKTPGTFVYHWYNDHDGAGNYSVTTIRVPTGRTIHHEAITHQVWVED